MILPIAVLGSLGVAYRYFFHDRFFNATRPKANSVVAVRQSRVSKIWGQLRLALVAILTFLATTNVISADAESITTVTEGIGTLITSVEGVISLVGLIITSVGSWFAKEKQA